MHLLQKRRLDVRRQHVTIGAYLLAEPSGDGPSTTPDFETPPPPAQTRRAETAMTDWIKLILK